MIRRFRALPLRSRLALLTALAVAVAVAVVSVTCWFIVQNKLYGTIDSDLSAQNEPGLYSTVADSCGRSPLVDRQPPGDYYFQIVNTDGTHCEPPWSAGSVRVTSTDTGVAEDPDPGVETYRNGTDSDGDPVRVLVLPVTRTTLDGPAPAGTALVVAYPLADTRSTLNELALILLLVSGLGAFGAGATGLWVARAGLRPVDGLARAVEHIARTEDLTVRIPVDGEDEIARLAAAFNSMTASLASSHDLQQQLIADAGHELRTPLTSLRTNIELLTRSEATGRAIPPADRAALLASLKAQMTELGALIGDLQELSRSGPGGGDGQLQVVPLHDTVRGALARARLRGPELTITAELAPWYVRAEPAALERALVNVLDNAVKFSPPGGTVEVALDRGVLTVRDHGPGIPAEELPHVFDRFWRSPAARALPGSGLGLSIVARTVRQAGGEVVLGPAEGGGTVATVRLPGAPTPPPGPTV